MYIIFLGAVNIFMLNNRIRSRVFHPVSRLRAIRQPLARHYKNYGHDDWGVRIY